MFQTMRSKETISSSATATPTATAIQDIAIADIVGKNQLQLTTTNRLLNDNELKSEENSISFHRNRRNPRSHPASANRRTRPTLTTASKFDVSSLVDDSMKIETNVIRNDNRKKNDEKWHEIRECKLSPEEERDLRVIENRQHLNPKRFYKSMGTGRKQGELPTKVHFGTVVEGAHEFYSSRLTKKERRNRIIDEVLADRHATNYVKERGKRFQISKMINKRVVDPAAKKRRRQHIWD